MKLQRHIHSKINEIVTKYQFVGSSEFVALRDAIVSRLTLFNARRGGEPCRLKISQYEDAASGRWVNKRDV